MATDTHRADRRPNRRDRYRSCLLKPMGRDGDQAFNAEHVIDAALVGAVAFCAVLVADFLPALFTGNLAYLSTADLLARIPTAAVAFFLSFFVMWARARGIDAADAVVGLLK